LYLCIGFETSQVSHQSPAPLFHHLTLATMYPPMIRFHGISEMGSCQKQESHKINFFYSFFRFKLHFIQCDYCGYTES